MCAIKIALEIPASGYLSCALWLFCGEIGPFCGNIGLFCGDIGLICGCAHKKVALEIPAPRHLMSVSAKTNYLSGIFTKEPCISAKEPYVSAKELSSPGIWCALMSPLAKASNVCYQNCVGDTDVKVFDVCCMALLRRYWALMRRFSALLWM